MQITELPPFPKCSAIRNTKVALLTACSSHRPGKAVGSQGRSGTPTQGDKDISKEPPFNWDLELIYPEGRVFVHSLLKSFP